MNNLPTVICENDNVETIMYNRGNVSVTLSGMNAALYRMMIWRYGKAEATELFWWLWHKKEGSE